MEVTSSFHVLMLVFLFLDCVCGVQGSDPKVLRCNITSKLNGSLSGESNQGDWCEDTSETETFNLTIEACLFGERSANLTFVNGCLVLHEEVRKSWNLTTCMGYRVKNFNYLSCKPRNCSSNISVGLVEMIFTYLKCRTSQSRKSFCFTCVPSRRNRSTSNECTEVALYCKFVPTTTTPRATTTSKSEWTKFFTEHSYRNSFLIGGAGVVCLVLLSAAYVCHRRRVKRKESRDLQQILTTLPRPDDHLPTLSDNSEKNSSGNFSQTAQEAAEHETEYSTVEDTSLENRDSFLDSESVDDNYTYPEAGNFSDTDDNYTYPEAGNFSDTDDNYTYPEAGNFSDTDDTAEYSYAYAHPLGYRMKKTEPFYENVEATTNSDYQERRPSDFEVHVKEPRQSSYCAFEITDEEVDGGKDGSLPTSNSASCEINSEPEVVYVDVCN